MVLQAYNAEPAGVATCAGCISSLGWEVFARWNMEHGRRWWRNISKYYQADSWSWRTLGSPWGRDVEFLHRTFFMEHDLFSFLPVHDPYGHKSQAAFSSTLFTCPISVLVSHHGLCTGLSPSIRYKDRHSYAGGSMMPLASTGRSMNVKTNVSTTVNRPTWSDAENRFDSMFTFPTAEGLRGGKPHPEWCPTC